MKNIKNLNFDKKYIVHTFTNASLVLLVVFLIVYLLYHVSIGFKGKAQTVAASYGNAYESVRLDAYVFRDESVIYSVHNGVSLYEAEENEKIANNSVVATVYSPSTSLSAISEIESLSKRIEILTEASSRAHLLLDGAAIDALIDSSLESFSSYIQGGDIHNAKKSSDELLVNLSRKQLRMSSQSNYDALISELNVQRTSLLRSLGQAQKTITVENGGYFSRKCDGYEEIFDFDRVSSMSCEDFDEMLAAADNAVHSTNTVGKIIESTEWYFVCMTDHNTTDRFTPGQSYDVTFIENMETTLPSTLERIVTQNGSTRALLIFKCTHTPPDFEYLRSQSVEISVSRVSGLQVPRSAVRYIDGSCYVYILYGEKVYLRAVEIVGTAGPYYYVKDDTPAREVNGVTYYGIRHNDAVITYGKNLRHEKIYGN